MPTAPLCRALLRVSGKGGIRTLEGALHPLPSWQAAGFDPLSHLPSGLTVVV